MSDINLHFQSFTHDCGVYFGSVLDLMRHARYMKSEPIPGDATHEMMVYKCCRCQETFQLRVPRRQ